ncbi:dimethylhistidine N-methyltransferase [Pandoraea vervacti]|uniref:Dimethylhistidine N-methyltransferase n=1 Tax=Pandoraea vervacti TaxID=656178 RepID=A0ABN4FXA5_9BURK|nr:L-histidine N(alpha)-methyltransferase [Pandoraea vervacti]AJP59964.2 dimethylhistidine N-methyltransferase [Pandoraea vervacti]
MLQATQTNQSTAFVCPSLPENAFATDVLAGLSHTPKSLPSVWLYDQRGSELFEDITGLDEYYQTRTETALLGECAAAIADVIGPDAVVVEFGSGSSRKTPLLLDALVTPRAYVPVDIADDFLDDAVAALARRCPGIPMLPVRADFTRPFHLPPQLRNTQGPRLGFFPGSTIGNFAPAQAAAFLAHVGKMLGPRRRMVVGVDACKDPAVLLPAYDDARGVTAQFDLNVLVRINRELDGDLPLDAFRHEARFNAAASRIEMHLVAQRPFTATVLGRRFGFTAGESIHTENSYKYGKTEFRALAHSAGWDIERVWLDARARFAVYLLRPTGD